MTLPHPEPARGPLDATHVDMLDYVLVPEGDPSSIQEHVFTAINDNHAIGLMQKEYATAAWTLYRLQAGQRQRIYSYPEEG